MKSRGLKVSIQIAAMAVCLLVVGWRPAVAATLTVTNTSDSGAGSLRQAIADAVSGDTIDFALTGCPCAIPTPGGQILIDKSLTIQGPGAHLLTLAAGNQTRLFAVAAGDVAITGLRMDGAGFSSQTGSAVLVEQTARLTLRRVLMANGGTNTIGGAVYQHLQRAAPTP
jgi:nitrous oxidase accessory protein NosD